MRFLINQIKKNLQLQLNMTMKMKTKHFYIPTKNFTQQCNGRVLLGLCFYGIKSATRVSRTK